MLWKSTLYKRTEHFGVDVAAGTGHHKRESDAKHCDEERLKAAVAEIPPEVLVAPVVQVVVHS